MHIGHLLQSFSFSSFWQLEGYYGKLSMGRFWFSRAGSSSINISKTIILYVIGTLIQTTSYFIYKHSICTFNAKYTTFLSSVYSHWSACGLWLRVIFKISTTIKGGKRVSSIWSSHLLGPLVIRVLTLNLSPRVSWWVDLKCLKPLESTYPPIQLANTHLQLSIYILL